MKEWEIVTKHVDDMFCTRRMKVPGGWLVTHYEWNNEDVGQLSSSICFLPDPNHLWKI